MVPNIQRVRTSRRMTCRTKKVVWALLLLFMFVVVVISNIIRSKYIIELLASGSIWLVCVVFNLQAID